MLMVHVPFGAAEYVPDDCYARSFSSGSIWRGHYTGAQTDSKQDSPCVHDAEECVTSSMYISAHYLSGE